MCVGRRYQPALLNVTIRDNSSYCGLPLSTIEIPEGCALLGLLRQEDVILINENPTLATGDIILAIALHPMLIPALKVALKRSHPVYYSLNYCSLNSNRILACCRLT